MTSERIAAIAQRHQEGASNKVIAQEFGVSPQVAALLLHTASRVITPVVIERDAAIANLYLAGASRREITQELNITFNQVDAAITRSGVSRGRRRGDGPRNDPAVTERNKQIVAHYVAGISRADIAQEFGVSPGVVSVAVTKAGVAQGRRSGPSPVIAARNQNIVELYRAGALHREIALQLGISRAAVATAIRNAGVAQKRRPTPRPDIAARNNQIMVLYRKGWSHRKIMRELGVDGNAVKYAVKRANKPGAMP